MDQETGQADTLDHERQRMGVCAPGSRVARAGAPGVSGKRVAALRPQPTAERPPEGEPRQAAPLPANLTVAEWFAAVDAEDATDDDPPGADAEPGVAGSGGAPPSPPSPQTSAPTDPPRSGEAPDVGMPAAGIGLCLSGGGIRSATFGLGVLQALAERNCLSHVHFLSTVSGGGYIGGWLSAWIRRVGLATVERELGRHAAGQTQRHGVEPQEVTWLRRYSNYLAPRFSGFSLDLLVLLLGWARNAFLNLSMVACALAVALILPRLLVGALPALSHGVPSLLVWVLGATAVTLFFVYFAVALNVQDRHKRRRLFGLMLYIVRRQWHALTLSQRKQSVEQAHRMLEVSAGLATACAWLGATALGLWAVLAQDPSQALQSVAALVFPLTLIGAVVGFATYGLGLNRGPRWRHVGYVLAFGAGLVVCAGVLYAARAGLQVTEVRAASSSAQAFGEHARVLAFGPLAGALALTLGGFVFVGLTGAHYRERSREAWSQLLAWALSGLTLWLAWTMAALYVPILFDAISVWSAGAFEWSAVLGTLASAVLAWLLSSAPAQGSGRIARLLGASAAWLAWVAAAGILALAAWGVHVALRTALANEGLHRGPAATSLAGPAALPSAAAPLRIEVQQTEQRLSAHIDLPREAALSLARVADRVHGEQAAALAGRDLLWGVSPLVPAGMLLAMAFLLLAWRVDVNVFSLNAIYRVRLVRCYLGASNARRQPSRFTGIDENDDLPLAQSESAMQRPLHLVNAAMNLTIGQDLGLLSQKSTNFVLSPMYCGYQTTPRSTSDRRALRRLGVRRHYLPTAALARQDPDLTIGAAIATSGAALSPNMGRYSSRSLAFVLTVLNVRLGRWMPNPRLAARAASPAFGASYLAAELLGWANDQRRYVYLSDGGHFENLGLYELVRRRCRLIVCVDAAADPARGFSDLANAIRQVRLDFGAEVQIDLADLATDGGGASLSPFAIGTVRYASAGAADTTGVLIYLKPSIVAGLSADVLAYHREHPDFPHQGTGNQFFSEAQFESYRALGCQLMRMCLDTRTAWPVA